MVPPEVGDDETANYVWLLLVRAYRRVEVREVVGPSYRRSLNLMQSWRADGVRRSLHTNEERT
jgi:hypothetical protein